MKAIKDTQEVIDNKDSYDPQAISLKWQEQWKLDKLYQTDLDSANPSTNSPLRPDSAKASTDTQGSAGQAGQVGSAHSPQRKPYYVLEMFPYPSAEGLHIGHIYTFSGADAFARFKRMQGCATFLPIGLDAFGIHSENYALKIGSHPVEQAKKAEVNFYRQFASTGNSFDWSRKLETNDPNYYKWTQWLFIELFKHGLAERKKAKVNFCPSCKTVLADEQVIDGKCERCGSVVEKRDLEQWFFKITKYADRLLENIKDLDWTQKVKTAQTNWIGRSEGAQIEFQVENAKLKVEVFTTRPDTLYGATFLVVAPDSKVVEKILEQFQDNNIKNEAKEYIKRSQKTSEQERLDEGKEKTGVFSGLYAMHPLTGEQLPIWIADYVLGAYGTGAIMAVPAHDKRDFEFAHKFHLPIKQVIKYPESLVGLSSDLPGKQLYSGEGKIINSDAWNGLSYPQDVTKILSDIEEKGIGKRKNTYHLRDWLISRQRYWGPPIPMIFCENCKKEGKSWFDTEEAREMTNETIGNWKLEIGNSMQMHGWYPVSKEELPVLLPYIQDFKPLGTGKAPLANHPEFYETVCPHCGGKARRETDVSDTFLDSSWYFLRYLATDWEDMPFPGQISHPKGTSFSETANLKSPVSTRSIRGGQISNLEAKIKSREKWLPVTIYIGGAEHSVLHLLYARFVTMFFKDLGYLDFEEPFSKFYAHGLIIKDGAKMSKSKGNVILPDPLIQKFGIDTVRLYLRFLGPFDQDGDFRDTGIEGMHRFVKRVWTLFTKMTDDQLPMTNPAKRIMHETIKGVTEDMEALRFNTAIAKLMTWYNFFAQQSRISQVEAKVYLQLLAPFAPHMTEELWERIGEKYSIHVSEWPTFDPSALVHDEITIVVQVNGKVRGDLTCSKKDVKDKSFMEEKAKDDERVKKYLEGKKIIKTIYVPGKVVNFVTDNP